MGLDIVEMVMAVEEQFDIEIPNAEAQGASTVGALFEWVRRRVACDLPSGTFSGSIWDQYLEVIARELGVARERLQPDARFVHDLHAD